jgi:hypothetical protein
MPRKKGGYIARSPRGTLFRLKAALNKFVLIALLLAGFTVAVLLTVDLMAHP